MPTRQPGAGYHTSNVVIVLILMVLTMPLAFGRDWGVPQYVAAVVAGVIAGLVAIPLGILWRRARSGRSRA
ncbi:hypothetical protein [Streptomyces sp. SID3343]|uniref:hypothetical protein n=1 Tax=Streptomyces sp. SID3343 TaxID=2690260 RepID=UPI00136C2F3E|nr:hypothetical protein [Streptomyces sp. SID3343]MYV98129.1 hypothetical protein [Streptomyces sp. SID3343]